MDPQAAVCSELVSESWRTAALADTVAGTADRFDGDSTHNYGDVRPTRTIGRSYQQPHEHRHRHQPRRDRVSYTFRLRDQPDRGQRPVRRR